MDDDSLILNQYDRVRARFEALREVATPLFSKALNDKRAISTNPIFTSRVKERSSLAEKITRKGFYNNLDDITDILGFRIIVNLENDVDKVLRKIEDNFDLDRKNCVDKRKKGNEPFGYQSVHYVVSLRDERFNDIKFEIQIRSMLQHAWAEIEHDLGYKGNEIPDQYRRDFSRVAALLETADNEFVKIKSGLTSYKRQLRDKISQQNEDILVDKASLSTFKKDNETLKAVHDLLASKFEVRFAISEYYQELIDRLRFLEVDKINTLYELIEASREHFLKFVNEFMQKRNQYKLRLIDTSPLYYFAHFLAAEKGTQFFKTYRELKNKQGYSIASQFDFCEIYEATKHLST